MAKNIYIFVDSNGNELRREPKGRGRPRKGAVEKEPGKFYVIIDPDELAAIKRKPKASPKKDEEGQEEIPDIPLENIEAPEGYDRPRRKIKKRVLAAEEQVTLDVFLSYLHHSVSDVTDGIYILSSGPIIKNRCSALPLPDNGFMNIWGKIVIDTNKNEIEFFVCQDDEGSKYVVTGLLESES